MRPRQPTRWKVDLALLGDEAQIHAAMAASGWTRADDISLESSLRIVASTLSRRSYPEATAIAFGVAWVTDRVLGAAACVGRNWARLLLMPSCLSATVLAFLATTMGDPRPTLGALPALALGILALLALTSQRARDYAVSDQAATASPT